MEIIQAVITLLSVIAAILAWVAKLRWSNEYKEAKEAQIELLERENKTLKTLTPMKLQEYLISTKEMLGEYNDTLKEQLNEKQAKLKKLEDKYELLDQKRKDESTSLVSEIKELKLIIQDLEISQESTTDTYKHIEKASTSVSNMSIYKLTKSGSRRITRRSVLWQDYKLPEAENQPDKKQNE